MSFVNIIIKYIPRGVLKMQNIPRIGIVPM
jgi:hypothetical protein